MASNGTLLYQTLFLFSLMLFFPMPCTHARLHGLASINNGEDLITTTCNHTLFFNLCVSSLRSDPRSETADINGLAAIALNLSITQAMDTIPFIVNLNNTLVVNDTTTLFESGCLSVCIGEYSDALDFLQDSIRALMEKSYEEVNRLVTDSMTDVDTCEDGFTETPEVHSPLTERNQYFKMLCSNFLAITKPLT